MARVVLADDNIAISIPPRSKTLIRLGKSIHALVRDATTFDQANSLELREGCQPRDRLIRQVDTTSEIDVPNPVAALDKPLNSVVGYVAAMAQMDVVQVLAQL